MAIRSTRWGVSFASMSAALAIAPQVAQAQAYQGTPTTALGTVSYDRSIAGVETIILDSARATINWAPSDIGTGGPPIVFLPNGNVVNYVAGTGAPGGQYTVLNRILATDPTRSILFDGAVNSAAGGSVWFYAPGGLLLGANARFNVGSLLLTTGDLAVDANNDFMPVAGQFGVSNNAGSNAQINIAAGAQINAVNESSYVVAVAPRIQQSGAINVNGSAALVAAEAVNFTYNGGLFDIVVTQGTDGGATAFSSTGSVRGPASSGAGDFHRIYMVAVPKNNAITMFVQAGGQLGFDVAGAADIDGNTIVLSAGHNVAGVGTGDPIAATPFNATAATLNGNGNLFSSNVYARAATNAAFVATGTPINFASNATISARNAQVTANTANVSVVGDLTLSADARSGLPDGISRTGGTASVQTSNNQTSSLTVGGNLTVTAQGYGGDNLAGAGGNGTGGSAQVSDGVNNVGVFTVGGNVLIDASGFGGSGSTNGGNATGGLAVMVAQNAASRIDVTGAVNVQSEATGGVGNSGVGGAAVGGTARINPAGVFNIGPLALASASAFGGNGATQGGSARGGVAFINALGPTSQTNISGDAIVLSEAVGGNGQGGGSTGGAALAGGSASITSDAGTVTITGSATVSGNSRGGNAAVTGGNANGSNAFVNVAPGTTGAVTIGGNTLVTSIASGGVAFLPANSRGGNATGGNASVSPSAANQTITLGGNVTIDATGRGGAILVGGPFGPLQASSVGGTGTGGNAFLSSSGGLTQLTTTGSDLAIDATGVGGVGGTGGVGAGGSAQIVLNTNARLITRGNVLLEGAGIGSNAVAATGVGGLATGGTARIALTNAQITSTGGDYLIDAEAAGGQGATGGAATGGLASIQLTAAQFSTDSDVEIEAEAFGGDGANGDGGNAQGGTAEFQGLVGAASTVSVTGVLNLESFAEGGNATGATGNGGGAVGGRAFVQLRSSNGTATFGSFDGIANAIGGTGNSGGFASGGLMQLRVIEGAATITGTASARTDAAGGNASLGLGGQATGGNIDFFAQSGTLASTFTTGSVIADASAQSGNGGAGASGAQGGSASDALSGNITVLGDARNGSFVSNGVSASSFARGGNGGAGGANGSGAGGAGGVGGNATSGAIQVGVQSGVGGGPLNGSANLGSVNLTATAIGGSGGAGGAGTTGGAGGRGGDADGGLASLLTRGSTVTASAVVNRADGVGGAGGTGGTGPQLGLDGVGGDGLGGTAQVLTSTHFVTGDPGTTTIATLTASAFGIGGASGSNSGGAGTGGFAQIKLNENGAASANTGRVTINGLVALDSLGRGGSSTTATSGLGQGGTSLIENVRGAIDISGLITASANGASGTGFNTGTSTGGIARIFSTGPNASFISRSGARLEVIGQGGDADLVSGIGGASLGGTADAIFEGTVAQLSGVNGFGLDMAAFAESAAGATGGNGQGGIATFRATSSQVTVGGFLSMAVGGDGASGDNGNGGNGIGGTARLIVDGTAQPSNATIDRFQVEVTADGGNANGSASVGGSATGGSLEIQTIGASAANSARLTINGDADIFGAAEGGGATTGFSSQNATGAAVNIHADANSTLQIRGNLTADVSGDSDSATTGAVGNGQGGNFNFSSNGGSAVLDGAATITAVADGGNRDVGTAGSAIGGTVQFVSNGGSVAGGGLTAIDTSATGGSSAAGNGGAATGGIVRVLSNAGSTALAGAVSADAQGIGGTGNLAGGIGGAGTGGTVNIGATGGAVALGSTLDAFANGDGGVGFASGGVGRGGTAQVFSNGGSTTIIGLANLAARGLGGDAAAGSGGTGGAGIGGANVTSVNNTTQNAILTTANVTQFVQGRGGIGGAGAAGQAGGAGGTGTGGSARSGSANTAGQVSIGAITQDARGFGGAGGAGGSGASGGVGGNATGGLAGIGTDTITTSALTGTFQWQSSVGTTSAVGGAGGVGGAGSSGGNGGNALGGQSTAGGARGGDIAVAGGVQLFASGIGGAGGTGTLAGFGGAGQGGNVALGMGTNPNAGGASTFTAAAANLTASGTGGAGRAPGSTNQGRADILSTGGTIRLASANLNAIGAGAPVRPPLGTIATSGLLAANNGAIDIAGPVSATVTGNVGIAVDNATATFGSTLMVRSLAGSIVDGITGTPTAAPGTFTAQGAITLEAFNGDIVTPASFSTPLAFSAFAGGDVLLGNLNAGSNISLGDGGDVTTGNIVAGGFIDIDTVGDIRTGNVTGGDFIGFDTFGSVTVGDVRGEDDIDFDATGNIVVGNVSAADSITAQTAGTITMGNLDAGRLRPSNDPATAYAIGLGALGNVTTGTISSVGLAGAISVNDAVNLGAVTTDRSLLALARTGVTLGPVSTAPDGVTYIADQSMRALLGPGNDPAPVFAAFPVALNGPVTINGSVNTGRFVSSSTGNFSATGPIVATGADVAATDAIDIRSAADVSTGNLATTLGSMLVRGVNVTTANLASAGVIDVNASGGLTLGNVRGDQQIEIEATGAAGAVIGNVSAGDYASLTADAGNLVVGNVDASLINPASVLSPGLDIGILAAGNVATGTLRAASDIGVGAMGGSATVGGVTTGGGLAVLASTGASLGASTVGGTSYIADASMLSLLGPDPDIVDVDLNLVFNAVPLAMAGPVSLTGSLSAGRFVSASTGTFSATGDITATLGQIFIQTPANISTAGLNTPASLALQTQGSITTGAINAGGDIDLIALGDIATGSLAGNGFIGLDSAGNITTGDVRGEDHVDFDAGGNVVAGNVSAADSIAAQAGGSIRMGNLDAGRLRPSSDPAAEFAVGLAAQGSVTTGAISARGLVGAASVGDAVSVGTVTTDRSLLVLARTGATLAGVTTAATGNVYIADSSMLALLGPNNDPTPVFAATPVALGGNISIAGPVSTGRLQAASTGSFRADAALNAAALLNVSAGGLATFNGAVSAPLINIGSADLDIGANATLGTAATTQLNLAVGQGVRAIQLGGAGGTGYFLSEAEMPRLRAQTILISVGGAQPVPVTLGTFTLLGARSATPNIASATGRFAVQTAGAIRVTGAVSLNDVQGGNRLSLSAGTQLQIVTDAGGRLKVNADAETLGGILELTAADIITGTGALVDQLSADPALAGRAALLDATPAAANLPGALGANQIVATVGRSFYVQNSGNRVQRAGFSAGTGGVVIRATDGQAGVTAIEVIINGQSLLPAQQQSGIGGLAILANGFRTNQDTRDAVSFTASARGLGLATSATVNSCSLTPSTCTAFAGTELAMAAINAGRDSDEIGTKSEEEEAEEKRREETAEGDSRPEVLISRMVDASGMTRANPVTEPVTGTGNPDLWLPGDEQ